MSDFSCFRKEEFLNLETYRKNGETIKSPMWFAQDNDALYLWTMADTSKVKRIRNNPHVNIAPCKRMGEVTGEWMTAHATIDDSPIMVAQVEAMLLKKIGLFFRIFRVIDAIRDRQKNSYRICIKLT
ncbi:MAG: PPOX class F420-dependent oxidoreductase [Chloroflexales bacterium]|nr:PPOX class F420-dependent oxidoreductase [Chloroflexales bacterium]